MAQEIEFKIDVWTPETIPQERLGAYLVELAKLYGEPSSVHFKRLRKGSAVLVSTVQETAIPKVDRRLALISVGEAPRDAVEAYQRIDDMLADDNAVGILRPGKGCKVITFPGRSRPKPVEYGPIREEGFVEGEIVRIGGRDKSVHVTLQDGDTVYSNIETDRDTARQLARLIYGPVVRLWGTGAWRRSIAGEWTIERFSVARFEVVGDTDFAAALPDLRAIAGSEWHLEDDPVATLLASRYDEGQRGAKSKRNTP
jgi:hypothetical protein